MYRAEIGLGVSGRRIPASRCGPRGRHLGRERGFSTVRGQVVGIGAVALEPGPGGVMIEVIGNGLTGGLEDVAVTVADGVVLLDAECRERGLAATCAFVDYYSEDLSDPIAHLYSGANAGFFLDLFGQIHVGDESVFIQVLGKHHRLFGGVTEAAAGCLLERARGEWRKRIARHFSTVNICDLPCGIVQIADDTLRVNIVLDAKLLDRLPVYFGELCLDGLVVISI